ncbi:hypothetical protein TUMEXPCC7403_16970 [Tumidithrix helvetica PCC 7403]|uniref:hypothetical protein n=1 Tax=Tumidithrix helvetica TaxID=3457545 RepID=UPI003CC055C0
MNFGRASLVSGNQAVLGFKHDDLFVGCEPVPDYILFYWNSRNGNQVNKFKMEWDKEFPIELTSIAGGENNRISELRVYQGLQSNSGNTIAWTCNFQNAQGSYGYMPYQFPLGAMLPPKSYIEFNLDTSCSWLQIIGKPCHPIETGILTPQN